MAGSRQIIQVFRGFEVPRAVHVLGGGGRARARVRAGGRDHGGRDRARARAGPAAPVLDVKHNPRPETYLNFTSRALIKGPR